MTQQQYRHDFHLNLFSLEKKPLKTAVIVVHNCEYVIATIIEISIGIVDGHIDHY